MLELTDLTKKYGDFTAVNHISLRVEKGEIFGLLGPNGAGKSTTVSMISTVLRRRAEQSALTEPHYRSSLRP